MHQNRQLQFPFHSENNEPESVNSSNRRDISFFDGHLLPAAFNYLKLIEPTAFEGLIAPLNILKGAQLEMALDISFQFHTSLHLPIQAM